MGAATIALASLGHSASAATIYWDGASAGWDNVVNWSTASGATTPDPSAVPGFLDDAVFNITTVNGAETVSLNANQSINSLTFNNTGTTLLQGNTVASANRTLTLGSGGITVNAAAGTVTVGSGTANQNAAITINGSQTWLNNSANALTIANSMAVSASTTNTLTFDGTANVTFNGSINNTVASSILNIVKNGAGTVQVGTAAGLTSNLQNGTLTVNGGTFNLGIQDFFAGGLTGSGGTIGNGTATSRWFFVNTGADNVFAGTVQNGGAGRLGINKGGMGTLTLSGATTYTDRTTVNSGTIEYGTTALPGIARTLSNSTGTGLVFGAGDSAVKSSSDGSGTATLTFGISESRSAGATANFIVAGGTNGTSNSIIITKAAGFIDQGTYFNGADFAWMDAANTYVRGIAYGSDAGAVTSGAAATLAATAHQDITGAISAQATATFTTLKIAGNNNFTLDTGATVTVNGILKAGNTAGGATISGGTGIQAASGAEFIVRTDGVNDVLTISTPILANGANALTKSGAGTLNLGATNTHTGTTTVTNGTLNVTGALGTGSVNVAGGVMNLSGTLGTNATNGGFRVGTIGGTPAVLNILPGAFATARLNLFVGDGGNGSGGGAVYQSGGTLTLTQGDGVDNVRIGSNATGYGYYNMSGGNLNSNRLVVGASLADTVGVLDMTGGTITLGTRFEAAAGSGGATSGLINIKGGTATAVTDVRLLAGAGGATSVAVLNVGGGTGATSLSSGNSATVGLNLSQSNNNVGALGVANLLTNGTLVTGRVLGATQVNATTHFNFNGGTLKLTAINSGTIFNDAGPDAINVYAAGGTIDNSGTNITLDKPLVAPAGSGVSGSSVSVPGGGAGYIGAPLVKLTGGTGSGATGYANVSGGVVTGITITSAGVGYTPGDTLTARFFGGGTATPAATVTGIAVAANSSGGLTFNGAGNTTLSAVNTYTGATNVIGGSLIIGGAGSINSSSGISVNGSGARFASTSSVAVTPTVTLTSGTVDGTGTINTVNVAAAAGNTIANGNNVTDPNTIGGLTINSLSFSGAGAFNLKVSSATQSNTRVSTTNLSTTGASSLSLTVNTLDGLWQNGIYNLVGYSGTIGGTGISAFPAMGVFNPAGLSTPGLGARQSKILNNASGVISLTIAGDNPKWTGALDSTWSTATLSNPKNWQLITGATATDYIEGDVVLFDNTASTYSVNVTPVGGVSPTSTTFASGDYTVTASGGSAGIAGAGPVVKSGSGSVALNSANSYSGGTTLSGGTLSIGHAQGIGTGALTITGGTLDNTSGSPVTFANAQNWNGDFAFAGSNDLTGSGAVTLSASRVITADGGGALAISGAIGGGSSMGITKNGFGKIVLSGNNTYSGSTLIRNGTLEVSGGVTGILVASPNSDIQIGPESGDDGTLLVSGGVVNANRVILGGNSPNTGAPGNGTVTQTGGTIHSQQWFTVGSGVDTASPASFPVGVYNNSGGTLNVYTQHLEVANFNATTGTVNLSGTGAINMYTNTSIRLGANNNAFTGTFNHNAGTVTFYSDNGTTVGGTGVLRIGHAGTLADTYTYNLNGGTLTVPQIEKNAANAATGIFNLAGGTLKAARANTTWIQNLSQFNASSGTIDDGGFAVTIPQLIAGSGTVTKQGTGTLTLTAANTFGGTVDVTAGTLAIGGTGALSNVNVTSGTLDGTGTVSNVTVANNIASVVANGNGTSANFNISSLTFNGAGKLSLETSNVSPSSQVITTTLLAANGAADSVVVDAVNGSGWVTGQTYNLVSYGGTIGGTGFAAFTEGTFTGLGPRQSGTLSNPVGFIALTIAGDVPVWTGALSDDWTTNTLSLPKNWELQTGGTPTDFLTGDEVIFDDTATGTTSIDISDANVSAAQISFNNSTQNYSVSTTGGYGIAAGSLVKNGTGALSITTANTYAGGTTLNAGTLNVNNASALGTGAVTITGGTLDASSGAITLSTNNAQNWNGDFAFGGSNNLDMGTGAVTLGGAGTSRTVTVNAGTLTVGELRGTTYDFVKQGAGTLVLTSTGAAGPGPGAADGSAVGLLNVAAGTLQFNRTAAAAGGSGDLSGLTGLIGGGTLVNGAAVERWVFITNAVNYDFTGTLANGDAGGLGIVKRGAATQTLSGANSYTGQTSVDAGTLVISGNNSGAGTNAVVNTGNLVLANTSSLGATSLMRLNGVNLSTLTYASDTDGTPYALTFGTGTIAAIVSDRATAGAGINHTLTTQALANGVGGGTINVTSGANVTSGMGRITFTQLGLGSGFAASITTLNPTTANVTIGTVSKQNNNVSQTVELGGTTAANFVTGGISDGPALSGGTAISVLKSNTSTWTIGGSNTYTGATTVNDGSLVVDGSLTTTSAANVTGGTLQVASDGSATRVLKATAVSVTGTGKIDLTDNKLITQSPLGTWNGSAYTDMTGLVQAGRGDGSWNGNGLVTSMSDATTSVLTTLAISSGAELRGLGPTDTDLFMGETINGDSTLVMYTWGGDADLNGELNGDDYFFIDSNAPANGSVFGFHQGDFDYNGTIDGDDYFVIDSNITFAQASPPFPTGAGGGGGGGLAAVPEPASIGVLGLAAASLLDRRRRRA